MSNVISLILRTLHPWHVTHCYAWKLNFEKIRNAIESQKRQTYNSRKTYIRANKQPQTNERNLYNTQSHPLFQSNSKLKTSTVSSYIRKYEKSSYRSDFIQETLQQIPTLFQIVVRSQYLWQKFTDFLIIPFIETF